MTTDALTRRKPSTGTHPPEAERVAPTVVPWRGRPEGNQTSTRRAIAIVDLGGQYCHLIARRLRDIGVWADIYPSSVHRDVLAGYGGVILSGGPRSVYDKNAPTVDGVLSLGTPVLGVCY